MCVETEKIKEQMIAIGGLMAAGGLVTGTSGNISTRVGENMFIITPSGIPYGKMEKTDLVLVDAGGRVIDGVRRPSTEFKMHLAIYEARPDTSALVHTHSVFASALAVAGKPLPPILEDMVQLVGGEVPVASYARAGTAELAASAVRALSSGNAVLLANHGLVGLGRGLEEAFQVCLVVEKAAQVFTWASMIGRVEPITPEEVNALRQSFLYDYGQPGKE